MKCGGIAYTLYHRLVQQILDRGMELRLTLCNPQNNATFIYLKNVDASVLLAQVCENLTLNHINSPESDFRSRF